MDPTCCQDDGGEEAEKKTCSGEWSYVNKKIMAPMVGIRI